MLPARVLADGPHGIRPSPFCRHTTSEGKPHEPNMASECTCPTSNDGYIVDPVVVLDAAPGAANETGRNINNENTKETQNENETNQMQRNAAVV